MKKSDKFLYLATLGCAILFSLLCFFLPEQISMGISSASLKSKYFLLLLALLPLVSTFLIATSDLSRKASALLLVLIEGYALLLVLQAFGFKINLPFIVFLLLALCCLYLAIVAREGRLKVFEQWSNDEEKNKKRGFLLFLLLALALFLFSVVSLLTSISPGFVIIPVLIVLIAFMIEEVISLKKAA